MASTSALPRTPARAPRGDRAPVTDPSEYGARVAVLSALARRGVLAPLSRKGAVTREVFALSGEHVLAPALRPGESVLLETVGLHYRERAVSLSKGAQASVEELPAYSPDCEPMAEGISTVKALRRTLKARTQRKLGTALKYALAPVTLEAMRGWFRHCGYTYSLN